MEFSVQYLSFFVIITEEEDSSTNKRFKHYQTMDADQYESSELKQFLDGEFARISKRKVERNPSSDQAPTKIGRFIVEPGHELTSNPNFNLFQSLRQAGSLEEFRGLADDMVRMYMDTSAVRGGAVIVASAKLPSFFDEPFVFVMKCDFEPKIARISEISLVTQVEMAISARNIKSIQYPFMPEDGMLEEQELKIHQASHARYFEDFLKYVSYEKPMPEIVNEQVVHMVQQYMEQKWEEQACEERQEEEEKLEVWAASDKRERLQEKWEHEQVMEATYQLVQHNQELELKFKLDSVTVKGHLADYGSKLHLARLGDRYVVLIEGETFQFDKGVSPIELLKPQELADVVQRIGTRPSVSTEGPSAETAEWTSDSSGEVTSTETSEWISQEEQSGEASGYSEQERHSGEGPESVTLSRGGDPLERD
ncbi:hypothetical protein J2TS4_44120 [Paenibacillus sp. J2TS4]|nr:DUF3900 domain-containing protein [Paenibacillus sp. J2TS4]GIP35202.1 hypothetical protein J2TS4_44120 [Paenibacillus sp. J2TS4]